MRSVDHRHSISSSGGENADLEASLISLQPFHGQSASDPTRPRGRARTLFGALRDSVSSSVILPDTVWTSNSDYAWDIRLLFRRRITTLYVSVSSLKSYVELNYSGFRKILKK
jgi:phosphate transporter